MSIFWQNLIIGAAIVIAVAYVAFYEIRKRRRRSACSSCAVLQAAEKRLQDGPSDRSDKDKDTAGPSKI